MQDTIMQETTPDETAPAEPDLSNHQAGEIWEQRTSAYIPVNFKLFRSSGDRWSDTVDVIQRRDVIDAQIEPVEISAASWNGSIEETKTFIAVLQKAVELAEARRLPSATGRSEI
jgi:hypothetical protein